VAAAVCPVPLQVWEWLDTLGVDPCFKILDPRIYPAQNRVQVCPGPAVALVGCMPTRQPWPWQPPCLACSA